MLRRNIIGIVTTLGALAALASLVLARASSDAQDTLSERDAAMPCPEEMLRVPTGTFLMGTSDGEPDERPAHEVTVSAFCIDQTEVTVAAYQRCVARDECRPAQSDDLNHTTTDERDYLTAPADQNPINGVSWDDAQSFCAWRGARLPSEAEWEYAARGTDARSYPWGNERPTSQNNLASSGVDCQEPPCGRTQPVGRHPDGASPFGVLDLAGNVWEWVADWYGPYSASPDPSGPATGTHRVIRGGGFNVSRADLLRSANRSRAPQTSRSLYVGFRCAQSAGVTASPD